MQNADPIIDHALVARLRQLGHENRYGEYLDALNEALAQVVTRDAGEPLVNLREHLDPRIRYDLVDLKTPASDEDRLRLRASVADRLNRVQEKLPHGWRLVIRDAFRSEAVVWALYERYLATLLEREPHLTREAADLEVRNLLAMPDDPVPPGHMTGGALDVILADADGARVPLTVDEAVLSRKEQMFTFHQGLPAGILANRRVLHDAMAAEGFHNYFREFWHYSYGDAYWAVRRTDKTALYGIPPTR